MVNGNLDMREVANNWEWNGKVVLITGIGGQDGPYSLRKNGNVNKRWGNEKD